MGGWGELKILYSDSQCGKVTNYNYSQVCLSTTAMCVSVPDGLPMYVCPFQYGQLATPLEDQERADHLKMAYLQVHIASQSDTL